ncbi:MAG: M28 family peptidase [Flavobacteriales bacterium]|nr:M28 family peptidase [Flavobacteriales bacterium]
MQVAKEKGASAIFIVPEDFRQNVRTMIHYIESSSMVLDMGKAVKSKRLTNFYISPKMADEILKGTGETIESLKKKIKKKTITLTCSTSVSIGMHRKTENLSSENVLGFIEGTDKKDEVVILTAHYDHIGIDLKNDEVYNGADDDGSGTVALLEIAEAFAKAKAEGNGPRRSILIMPVAGEEKGLLGSEYYSENPVYPLDRTIVDLNIDMIGRLDEKHADDPNYVYIIGSTMLSTELHAINEKANSTYTNLDSDYEFNTIDDPNRYYYRSDHYNFAKKNIPVIFYFNGVHVDYHKPTDTVDKINYEKMETITKLVFYTAWQLANQEKTIEVDVVQE